MKITDIRIHVLKSPLAEPFAFSQGWVHQRSATLVEVLTDEGITGWGEAFAQGMEPPEIAATVIDKALRPLMIGADPLATEVLWHRIAGSSPCRSPPARTSIRFMAFAIYSPRARSISGGR